MSETEASGHYKHSYKSGPCSELFSRSLPQGHGEGGGKGEEKGKDIEWPPGKKMEWREDEKVEGKIKGRAEVRDCNTRKCWKLGQDEGKMMRYGGRCWGFPLHGWKVYKFCDAFWSRTALSPHFFGLCSIGLERRLVGSPLSSNNWMNCHEICTDIHGPHPCWLCWAPDLQQNHEVLIPSLWVAVV